MDLFICIVLDHNVNQKKHSKSLTLLCCEQHPFSQILPLICVCDKQPYLAKLGYSCHPSSDFRASKEVGWFGCLHKLANCSCHVVTPQVTSITTLACSISPPSLVCKSDLSSSPQKPRRHHSIRASHETPVVMSR